MPTTFPKWVIFTYIGKQTKYIAKLFKQIGRRIAYMMKITIENVLMKELNDHDIQM